MFTLCPQISCSCSSYCASCWASFEYSVPVAASVRRSSRVARTPVPMIRHRHFSVCFVAEIVLLAYRVLWTLLCPDSVEPPICRMMGVSTCRLACRLLWTDWPPELSSVALTGLLRRHRRCHHHRHHRRCHRRRRRALPFSTLIAGRTYFEGLTTSL